MANAATVQITFGKNYVSTLGSSFDGDLTGDGELDAVGYTGRVVYGAGEAVVWLMGGSVGRARGSRRDIYDGYYVVGYYTLADVRVGVGGSQGRGFQSIDGVASIVFSDFRINGGAPTSGWVDMTAEADATEQRVTLHRLIFDDASTNAPVGVTSGSPDFDEFSAIPEPSSLGLLALGAGGLLARRRRDKAAA